jgi:signal transduction histidine kinase/ligand-binding sensor domain-containing protein/DNA-binding response OmpR family regulator
MNSQHISINIVRRASTGSATAMWFLKVLIIFNFQFSFFNSFAQTGHFYPSSLFSSGLVSDLCQDKYGNIWIATDYGLNRFDGYHFTTWLHSETDSTTIKSNTVVSLLSDGEGGLWVGTNRGLDHYSPTTNTFRHFRFPGDIKPRVTEICRMRDGSLFICTAGFGGYSLNADGTLTLNQRYAAGDEGYYRGIYEDSRGRIWKYSYSQTFVMTDGDCKEVMQSTVGDVLSILERNGQVIIVGVYGLMAYDGRGLRTADIDMSVIAGRQVLLCAVETDANGNIYIGTRSNGLYRIPRDRPRLERVEVTAFGIDLNTAKVWDIMVDRKGNLWTGLQNKGLMMIPQRPMQFSNWSFGAQNVRLGASVSSVCEGDGGMTWCTVQGIGVYGFDERGRLTAHPQAPADVEFIYRDPRHRYWLGTDDGLYSYDPTTGHYQRIVTYECEKFNTMTTDADGSIYISTFSRGFCIFNPATGQLRNYNISMRDSVHGFICNNWVMAMTPDRDGCIWMATASGVSCYDPRTDSFRPQGWHQLLNGVMCFSLCELSDGNFAIGTEQGLWLYDRKKRKVASFPGSEQLSDKTVTYIIQARNGDIWCSTSMGLWQYDRRERHFIGHINGNGLTTKEYLYGVGLHIGDAGNDRIFFGTNDGLTTFMPDQVKSGQQVTDSLWLTELIVVNQPVSAETVLNGVHITRQAVPESDNFQLSYHDNTFTMVFSQLNFRNPSNVAIEYCIDGGAWLRTNYGTNSITLSQMRPGTYHIDVRALVGGGYSPVKSITVTILAPWYRTTLAYGCYLLLLLSLLGYIAYAWRRHARQQLDEERMKFLINATHDIRSPLTLIMGPLGKLKNLKIKQLKNLEDFEAYNASVLQPSIDTIDRNAKRILNLVNQILDVRKIDKQQMQLHCKPICLASFIRTVCRMYDYNAQEHQIRFSFTTDDEEAEVWIDPNLFDKVIANLLSNAFKFSREGGSIDVRLTYTDLEARLQVIDDGVGMDEDTLKHVFDRFYQGDNTQHKHVNGTGIGLNLCKMIVDMHHGCIEAQNRTDTQGSVFTVSLPLGNGHLKEEEKAHPAGLDSHPTNSGATVIEPVKSQAVQKVNSRKYNVLIVDDDEELGQYISKELSHYYKFTICLNGKDGLKELLSGIYHVVLSDVMMPEMDGFTMLRLIKTNSNISHIPVIMLSSKADIGNRLEGLDRGADAFLPKPFDMEELHKTIDNLIQSRLRLKGKFTGAQEQADKLERPEVKGNNELLMERIMKAINQNLGDSDFNVDRLSQEVGISRAQLHRKMKEMTGISPSEFVRNIRLEQAARLLREQKINVTQVTYIVGFANLAHFSTVFRKHFGVSPSDYAEEKNRLSTN